MGKVIVVRRSRLIKREVSTKPSEYKAHASALAAKLSDALLRADLSDEVRALLRDSLALCREVAPVARRPKRNKVTYESLRDLVYRLGPECKSNHELHTRVMKALGPEDADGNYPVSVETIRTHVTQFYTIRKIKVPS
jgi:hypothetical protein